MTILYALFAFSVFFPLYTYVIYPLILRCMKEIKYKSDDSNFSVSVIIIGKKEYASKKIANIKECSYQNVQLVVSENYSAGEKEASGNVLIFTDLDTRFATETITELVRPFSDKRVGCVVGQQTNLNGNSAYWKYENSVKELESRIGCVSGATASVFAIRKEDFPCISEDIINIPFYISMSITEKGMLVVYQQSAKTFETITEGGLNFRKHVRDAAGYWQCLKLFPRMFFLHHGSFAYIGHRVIKMFVWLNMLSLMLVSALLGIMKNEFMARLFLIQIIGYLVVYVVGKRKRAHQFGKVCNLLYYFISLNFAFFITLFEHKGKKYE